METTQTTRHTGLASFTEAYETLLAKRPGVLASESGGELAWLKKARERDALRWQSEGLPQRRMERWKYTSFSTIEKARVVLPLDAKAPPRANYPVLNGPLFSGEAEAEIVFFNGQFIAEWSKFPTDAGVSLVVLSELFNECVNNGWTQERRDRFALFRAHVETSDADRETVFAAMNTSFMQDGVLLQLRPGCVLQKPIVVVHLADSEIAGQDSEIELASPRLFAHLERGSSAGLIEVFSGGRGHRYFTNAVSDLRLEETARLSHCRVQLEGNEGVHVGTTRVHQKRASFCESFQFSFGAKLARQDLHMSLEGQGAEAVLDGLYMAQGDQHIDNYTLVDHLVPHTTSEQIYKGVLDHKARGVFNGHVRIRKDAQKSQAAQLNNNLLLSPQAEIDTKPELEIEADDVKAAHGATIGRIDPEHVFYLQTRAIGKDEATKILSKGFAQDVVFRIRHEGIKKRMLGLMDERFAQDASGDGDGV